MNWKKLRYPVWLAMLAAVIIALGAACAVGTSMEDDCSLGLSDCGGSCVNLSNDSFHCGQCGRVCAVGQTCYMGECVLDCSGNSIDCGGMCVNTLVDPQNCGGCANDPNPGDHVCLTGEVCVAGVCDPQCPIDWTNCAGVCVDTQTDPGNCGECADDPNPGDHVCTTGESCIGGVCVLQCPVGQIDCGGVCLDTQTDPGNCGGCANVPNPGDHICAAGETCVGGTCTPQCPAGQTYCGVVCVDTQTDPGNCGGCANVPNPGDHVCATNETCTAGACVSVALGEVYSEPFYANQVANAQCMLWLSFRASLTSGYASVTMSGTYDTVGITCNDPTIADQIAYALNVGQTYLAPCNGHTWHVCERSETTSHLELWLDPPSSCDYSNCPDPGYLMRPCFGIHTSWGGVNTNTCNSPPDQTMTVTFTQ